MQACCVPRSSRLKIFDLAELLCQIGPTYNGWAHEQSHCPPFPLSNSPVTGQRVRDAACRAGCAGLIGRRDRTGKTCKRTATLPRT